MQQPTTDKDGESNGKDGRPERRGHFSEGRKSSGGLFYRNGVFADARAKKTESNDYSIGSVTFEPGARSNWHTHPAGQTLIVINGKGLYQEKGMPVRTINKGETIICKPNVEHWHGASPESQMTHIAITNDRGDGGVVWLTAGNRRPIQRRRQMTA